jgi:hypothetical protein
MCKVMTATGIADGTTITGIADGACVSVNNVL